MMSHFMCCFLLLTSVIVSSEKRKVQRDSFVLLFETTLTEDNVNKEISLHLNGAETPSLIAKWKFENGAVTTIWRLTNYPKIFMDSKRNIMIANIDEMYEGKYYIQYFPSLHLREVELSITGNLADEIGEKIQSWLNDLKRFIEKHFGNSTDEIREEITERLNNHNFGCESPSGYPIAILVIVTALLGLFLMVHGSEVCKLLINAWSWCRKYRDGPHLSTQWTADSTVVKESGGTDMVLPREPNASINDSGGTDMVLPREPNTFINDSGETTSLLSENQASDSASNKPSVETNPCSPREDAHLLPRSLPTPMNIPGSEADFKTTAQGKKKIHIRETKF